MILSPSMILALTLLLLPVPLAFLIPAAANASADPRRIRRMRRALIGFAVGVALIQFSDLWSQHRLFDGPPPGGPTTGIGVFGWAVMSWLLLGSLIVELRRQAPESFPGESRRAASLAPRHLDPPVPSWAWWSLGGVWGLATLMVVTLAPNRPIGVVLLIGAGVLLIIGNRLSARSVIVAEPLLPEDQPDLRHAYRTRRRVRGWTLFAIISISVIYKCAVAATLAWSAPADDVRSILIGAVVLIAVAAVVCGLLEAASIRRIRNLRTGFPSSG